MLCGRNEIRDYSIIKCLNSSFFFTKMFFFNTLCVNRSLYLKRTNNISAPTLSVDFEVADSIPKTIEVQTDHRTIINT